MENGLITTLLAADTSRAFDSVEHKQLVDKLGWYGVDRHWFGDWLCNRTRRIQGSVAGALPVTHGVVQGSILGTRLFLLFTNDLASHLPFGKQVIYADDVQFIDSDAVENLATLKQRVENTLELALKWFTQNRLKINPNKTELWSSSLSRKSVILIFQSGLATVKSNPPLASKFSGFSSIQLLCGKSKCHRWPTAVTMFSSGCPSWGIDCRTILRSCWLRRSSSPTLSTAAQCGVGVLPPKSTAFRKPSTSLHASSQDWPDGNTSPLLWRPWDGCGSRACWGGGMRPSSAGCSRLTRRRPWPNSYNAARRWRREAPEAPTETSWSCRKSKRNERDGTFRIELYPHGTAEAGGGGRKEGSSDWTWCLKCPMLTLILVLVHLFAIEGGQSSKLFGRRSKTRHPPRSWCR